MGGLRFYANERFQKGRGIGGLFRAFRSLISPIMKIGSRIGKTALKAGSRTTHKSNKQLLASLKTRGRNGTHPDKW